ncbi:MAG: type II secretion system F family protein [Candidatus Nanoarchaeia archaeon]
MDFDLIFTNFLIALLAGSSVFCLTYFVFLSAIGIRVEKSEEGRQLPILFKILLPFAGNLSPIVSNTIFESYKKSSHEKILMAGLDQQIDDEKFVAVNILSACLGLLALVGLTIYYNFLSGLMAFVFLSLYPKWWLDSAIRKRHLEIQKALPNVLDLLTLSVEAGRDFLTALRDILARRRRDALCEELERAFREIQLGKQRRNALKELAQRVQQPDLTVVLNAIVQADELGVSIGQILRIQSDLLRLKRFNRAEKLANEAPVKILFPLALFIMPAVIIILLGPVILKGFNILLK